MPTNYGALQQNLPAPNGRVQIKRGAVDTSPVLTTTHPSTTILTDGSAGNTLMGITYMATYPCYWIVHSNVMAHGVTDSQGWRRWDHSININPADADGRLQGFQCPHQVYDNATIEWRTVGASYTFRLNPGILYTAYLTHTYLSKGSVRHHTGPLWNRIIGRIVGEGFV